MGAGAAEPVTRAIDSRWPWLALAAVLCAPGMMALYFEVVSGIDRAPAVGDAALLELGTRHALSLEQWLGPYSRHRWHHPGPLYFYLLSPAYLLGGQTASSLHAGVAVFNLALLLALVRAAGPLLLTPFMRLCGCVVLSLWLHHFNGLLTPTGWSVVWSPVAMLMPYGLLLVSSSRLSLGEAAYAIPSVLLHALLAQTHVAFVPLASAALLAGGVGYLLSRRRTPGPASSARAHLGLGAALLVVLWLPVIVDQVARTQNLAQVVAFFLDGSRSPQAVHASYAVLAAAAVAPLLTAFAVDSVSATPIAVPLITAQAFLLPWLTVRTWRRADWAGLALLALGLTQSIVAAVVLGDVDDPQLAYLTHWLGLLFCWNWLAIARGYTGPVAPLKLASASAARVAGVACLLVAIASGAQQVRAMPTHSPWLENGMLEARTAVSLFSPILAASRKSSDEPPLRIGDNDAWPVAAGLVLEAHRSGEAQTIDPDWAFMFGDDLPTSDGTAGALTLTLAEGEYGKLLAHSGPFHLYRRIADEDLYRRTPGDGRVRLEPWGASGLLDARKPEVIEGEGGGAPPAGEPRRAALIVDGEAPVPGSPWDHPGAVVLRDSDAWIALRLPPVPIAGLRILADHNDVYRVDGALGGGGFEQIAITSTTEAPGLQWREVSIPRDRIYSTLRLSGSAGDGLYSIAEVEALAGDGFVVHMGRDRVDSALGAGWGPAEGNEPWRGRWVTRTEATLTIPASPGVARTLVFTARPFTVDGQSQTLHISSGSRELTRLTMDPQLRSYAVGIPPLDCAQACTLRLHFGYAHPRLPSPPTGGPPGHSGAAWFEALFVVADEGATQ